jgi:hypothetical protein
MISEIFWSTGLGRRLRQVITPTPGAKKINSRLYSLLGLGPVVGLPQVVTPPVISGTGAVGQVLTCTPGTYVGAPTPTITRQWRRNTTDLGGQTGLTYTIQAADAGQSIACRETATNTNGSISSTSNVISVAVVVVLDDGNDDDCPVVTPSEDQS